MLSARDSAPRMLRILSIGIQSLLDARSCLVRDWNLFAFPSGFLCMPILWYYTRFPMMDCLHVFYKHCSAQSPLWMLSARDSASRMPHCSRYPATIGSQQSPRVARSCLERHCNVLSKPFWTLLYAVLLWLLHHRPNDGLSACLLGTLQCPKSSLNRRSWSHRSSIPDFDFDFSCLFLLSFWIHHWPRYTFSFSQQLPPNRN